ncbi:MAG: glycosyltransferase family 4 protein [Methanobacterium sp.]|uniref:glycosyltransferase family 4 protein n=1 Tax=Methanobacterium sp. TaxID=2164 RepID=UPI003D651F35|nr:glycosyltransferase family 4 protein [Methanobacterium sp.]
MKLLMVYGDPRVEMFGGVEEHTNNIIHYLSKKHDINIHVLTYGNKNEILKQNDMEINISKRLASNIALYMFLLPFDLYRLMKKINKQNFDVIHFQGFHPLYCMAAMLCQRKYPTVVTLHGISSVEMDYHVKRNFILKFFSKFAEKFALSRIKNIIVVAPQIEEIIQKMTDSKTFMIPNGVNIDLIKSIGSFQSDKNNVIFYIGTLVRRKGLYALIKAFQEVKKSISDSYLYIAGSGDEENELKDLVKELGLENDVKFFGFVKGDRKYSLIKSANVFVLPSFWESLPIAVLEGIACGKPVIASNVGGIPYLVNDGENGFLVMPGEVDELSDKLITLLKDKKLQEKMGNESLKRSEDFDWNKISDKTIEVYNELINNKRD